MSGADRAIERQLVAGRSCGACDVCCVALTIDDPALRKAQGYRCHHVVPGYGCGIYDSRPKTCRTFYCGWRLLRWIPDALRPDTSDVLVRLSDDCDAQGEPCYRVTFTLLTSAGLQAAGLAEAVSAAIAAKIPTFLVVPGPPGWTGAEAQINHVLQEPVRARNKAGVLAVLRDARLLGESGPRKRVVLE